MSFLDNLGIGIYFFIFFGKILEVTIATLRRVLISRGERVKGAIIAFFDNLTWVVITGTVLTGFQDDPLRILIFVVAFATGTYLGSWLEEKLAFGLSSIEVIIPESKSSKQLADVLRDSGFGVTVIKGFGRSGTRDLLLLYLKRKHTKKAKSIIDQNCEGAVIVVTDSKKIKGGYSSIR